MQRRQFTQSLVAASTGLLWATSSRAVGLQDPMDSKTVSVGCSLDATGPLASLARELKHGLDAGLERAGRELTRGKLRAALASVRSHDMGGMTVDYSNGAPYVGSRFVNLGILGANGRMVG